METAAPVQGPGQAPEREGDVPSASAVLLAAASACGFEHVGLSRACDLQAEEAVRAFCSGESCASFGKNWTCPDAVGSLGDFQRLFGSYESCLVFQTTQSYEGRLEYQWYMDVLGLHDRRCAGLIRSAEGAGIGAYFLMAEPCSRCHPCTYPQACPYPGTRWPSMEAAGLMVGNVCRAAGLQFHYGRGTFTYTSCALLP